MWGTEVARGDGPVPFLVYEQRRRRVTELLDDAARWAGRDHLLVQDRRRVTFAAMTAAADRVAGHLSARGLGPGDRLLLLTANSPEWVISLWAGLRLGALVAPGNRWWSTDEIAHAGSSAPCPARHSPPCCDASMTPPDGAAPDGTATRG